MLSMNVRSIGGRARLLALATLVALGLGACGGGGGGGAAGGGNADGVLEAVSFIGFSTMPSGVGPNGLASLPQVFVDQALEFTFDGPIDGGIFGGFVQQGSDNRVFLGKAPGTASTIPYFGYVNQTLAAQSLQVRINAAAGATLPSYIVGRHRDKPNTIVLDPRVPPNNPFGLPPLPGFPINAEMTYRIPATNSFLFGGTPARPIGTDPFLLPVIVPAFSPQPDLSVVFRSSAATSPNPFPPEVVSIEAFSGAAGTVADPINCDDPIIVTFSQPIDGTTIDQLKNFTIRNLSAGGTLVPGQPIVDPLDATVLTFVPQPGYGPGPFDIEVRVGRTAGLPQEDEIDGLAQGSPPVAIPLLAPQTRIFRTEVDPTCPGSITVAEDFIDTLKRDANPGAFVVFNQANWNAAAAPGALVGSFIDGTPLATFTGNPLGLGTRFQRMLTLALGCFNSGGTCPAGLLAPFDSVLQNAGTNPMGGSHLMLIWEAADLGSPRAALELIEWGPVMNNVRGTTYPGYTAWCGMTTIVPGGGGVNCTAGGVGLSTFFGANYDVIPQQPVDLLNANPPANNGSGTPNTCPMTTLPVPLLGGGVRVGGPMDYVTNIFTTTYFPYPVFTPPFDYIGSGTGARSLLFEVNILPGPQLSNINRFRAAGAAPGRRVIGPPKAMSPIPNPNCFNGPVNVGQSSQCEFYDMRLTFVDMVSHAQSQFYDTNVPMGAVPVYNGFNLSPSPFNQPANTSAIWQLEGANAISGPTSASGPTSGFQTFFSGTPANGVQNDAVLGAMGGGPLTLAGRRFFRFRVTLRNDNLTNMRQRYNNWVMSISF